MNENVIIWIIIVSMAMLIVAGVVLSIAKVI